MFVVSKIIPISYFHLGIRFPGFAKGFFVPFSLTLPNKTNEL